MSLDELTEAINIAATNDDEWSDRTVEELARAYLRAKDARNAIDGLLKTIESRLLAAMGDHKQVVIDGLATIERKSGAKRTGWEDEMVAPAVVTEYVKQDTGELLDPHTVDAVTRAFLATAGVSYWKVTELKRLGIDPARYCTETWGEPRAVVRAVEGGL